ncbi:MAG: PaaI family thioesterase [Nitrospirae bacterium CG_4_10_14_3_um_filter_44_29]|nr:PaaI family thioesterase [Nitrospirota bacterium]PIP69892.1 MAG: phenylacetic acid degradation protein [Nitrospirae bacterium CG22_combo_CG10-13_8_21_14_all_44_11]PIV44365.1 MAG: PaaI family thioesterase [Nitrospirae bacterium CG02_land_8_20_14_3_00_44_33]PIV65651.1 MAG: PaaI family thioesterase [Nitrospirae bacterium CG01_land_8_20_14_3_00_44_22]PIX89736.1 MAG: PaaI family thioesterase [Nitrospirae bacterium CG_4_10_14_3_um_filter_44_29]PJA81755.1 MAG: PaaI family thioesterase [Nitrospirae
MYSIKLEDDNYCFACGRENPCGLKLSFHYSSASGGGKLTTEFTPVKMHQGYKDITHGGIITTVLDEAMIQAAIAEGINPVTAEINIRFKKPLMAGEETIVTAEITKRGTKLIEAFSSISKKKDGTVIAEAHAKLIPLK